MKIDKNSVGIVETKYFTFAEPPNEMLLECGRKFGPITLAYETYGKLTAIAFIWTIFGLPMLGLALAVRPREQLARALFLAAMVAAIVAGLIATWLIASTGGEITPLSPFGLSSIADENLLRPLAVALVLLSTSWFGALAASRLEQS